VHERQSPGLIDSPNDLEARKMLVAVTSGDRSALSNLYMTYYGSLLSTLPIWKVRWSTGWGARTLGVRRSACNN
jgi:hypothetical protein